MVSHTVNGRVAKKINSINHRITLPKNNSDVVRGVKGKK